MSLEYKYTYKIMCKHTHKGYIHIIIKECRNLYNTHTWEYNNSHTKLSLLLGHKLCETCILAQHLVHIKLSI